MRTPKASTDLTVSFKRLTLPAWFSAALTVAMSYSWLIQSVLADVTVVPYAALTYMFVAIANTTIRALITAVVSRKPNASLKKRAAIFVTIFSFSKVKGAVLTVVTVRKKQP